MSQANLVLRAALEVAAIAAYENLVTEGFTNCQPCVASVYPAGPNLVSRPVTLSGLLARSESD